MRPIISIFLATAGLFGGAACISTRPVHYYAMQAPPRAANQSKPDGLILLVGDIAAPEVLQDSRIRYRSGSNEAGAYEYHRWTERPGLMVRDALMQLEPIFSGVTSAWKQGPKLAWFNDGNIDRHLRGSWSQYNIGQYTGFSGIEGVREGNIHFAGEHTSYQFQGFIEGAVRTGIKAAREIG